MFNDRNKKNQIRQIQAQESLSAYDRKTTHDIFFMTMEWLEKYIEIAGYYPDWENRKQIKNNNIKRKDIYGNPEKVENSLSTQLVLFKDALDDDPSFLRDEIKEEFYRWVNSTSIDSENCPERLKHFLFGINEIIEGRGEKIQRDIENRKRILDPNSPEYMEQMNKVFAHIQNPMHNERETRKYLENKTHRDIEIGSKFGGGNSERGKQAFGQIADSVSGRHSDFYFFPQKIRNPNYNPLTDDPSEEFLSSSTSKSSTTQPVVDPQQLTNVQVIQEFKNNRQDWRIDEVITEYDNLGNATKREQALIHKSAEIGLNGEVYGSQPVYPVRRFNQEEIGKINEILSSSQSLQPQTQTSTSSHRGGKGGGSGGLGGYGSSVMWGSFTVISLIGLAFVK
jgi:hypothetical protein